jgi:pimeloyl-ACP methyl ester carboxylesterase
MKRNHIDDLRGASRLAIEATTAITDLVQAMHRRIAGPFAVFAELPYAGVRGVTSLVGAGIDGALARLAPLVGDAAAGPEREAVIAALNGVLGDYLAATGNPLAIPMRLRRGGVPIEPEPKALLHAIPDAGAKLLVLVHGSSMFDLQWRRGGHDHGEALAKLGYTPIYLHYNSGLHISENGRALATLLEALVGAWPQPLDELTLFGHSMGGLVSRSACHAAAAAGHRWPTKLRNLISLGSPHHGAPLERFGNMFEVALGISSYSAPFAQLGKLRSAGVTDLRFGNVRDEDWQDRDRFEPGDDPRVPLPLPQGVRCFAIAGTTADALAGELPGDGIVPVDSALGRHSRPELTLEFPPEHRSIATGTGHLDLLGSSRVHEVLARWLQPPPSAPTG